MDARYSLFLTELSEDNPQYSIKSLLFICRGIEFFNQTQTSNDSDTILNSLYLHAFNEYGPLALFTLNKLNFYKNSDFVTAINLLIEKKIFTGIEKLEITAQVNEQNLSSIIQKKALPEPAFWPKIKKVNNFQRFLKI
ncbi:hypothetical protein PQO03_07975 [Lentisphaera profundi]|uniref:Uncharacterized protein n=1 Tax=Lentisphaera profundi TaxID=1658616 RepID=A0ABY7VPB8_9BACT|nr:hypothetical protein [Lentisphaera profundi]WDE95656.1 hypothetical protein PQO03_07975 [Lentisphaera profundi]